ncbi:hypothetical protein [Carboxylicivirga sp. RSCT41]|uniref:hypothetical protein n=1 Tax=Carboxylicivirga agarovorans TaxID=3417570 RepID=UPI003D34EE86
MKMGLTTCLYGILIVGEVWQLCLNINMQPMVRLSKNIRIGLAFVILLVGINIRLCTREQENVELVDGIDECGIEQALEQMELPRPEIAPL